MMENIMKLPIHAIDGDYIREWLVLGPLFPNDLEIDFLADVGGETNVQPQEGDIITIADGKELTWERHQTKGNIIHLHDIFGYPQSEPTVYAACILQSQTTNDALISFSSGGDSVVWINGQQVYSVSGDSPIYLEQHFFEVQLKVGDNHCLVKLAKKPSYRLGFGMRARMLLENRAVISGIITDETGTVIPNASVHLEQDGLEIARTQTDSSGRYQINVYPVHGQYELSAMNRMLGAWQLGLQLHEGERRKVDMTLKSAVNISGTLMAYDGVTRHVAIPVQAIRVNTSTNQRMCKPRIPHEVVSTTLSDEKGEYQFVNLKPGQYQVRCQTQDGYIYYEKSLAPSLVEAFQIEREKTILNIDFCFPSFKKGQWKNYGVIDGLLDNHITAIYKVSDEILWFGTQGGGVFAYDGEQFINFTQKDGLPNNDVTTIYGTPDGMLWIGTWNGGLSRYEKPLRPAVYPDVQYGKTFVNFTTQDGLPNNCILSICHDEEGMLWLGTNNGLSRYDGQQFVNFNTKDGLAHHIVTSLHCAPGGVLWIGTLGGGVSRYDGKTFVNFTTQDGLADNWIFTIYRDKNGMMWFGTKGGASQYDEKGFVNLTMKDGLADNWVHDIHQDTDEIMWFGTGGWRSIHGVSRYDGKTFVNFTVGDGLVGYWVTQIYRDANEVMWFGTWDRGVSRYDDKTFVSLTAEDGLIGNHIKVIHCAPDGAMWFGTLRNGVSQYDGKRFVNFTTKEGLAHDEVWAIHSEADGVIWFGTTDGLSRYDGKRFTNFTTDDGLPFNEIYAIHHTQDNVMWFGTWAGLS